MALLLSTLLTALAWLIISVPAGLVVGRALRNMNERG